ncbi:hypothetical protein CYMTET_24699, partial [Cymbomonas tetramitiformis]
VLRVSFGLELARAFPLWVLGAAGTQAVPWVLNLIIHELEEGVPSHGNLALLAGLYALGFMWQSLFYKRCWMILATFIGRLSYSLRAAVFHKMLRMSSGARLVHSSGQILNMAASDIPNMAQNMPGSCWGILDVVSNLLLSPFFLYRLVGASFLYGCTIWIVIVPGTMVCSRRLFEVVKRKLACADKRVSVSSEVFESMGMVKLLGCERVMVQRIFEARTEELKEWRHMIFLNWTMSALASSFPLLLGPITLAIYNIQLPADEPASLATMFTALAFIWQLQSTLMNIKPIIVQLVQMQVVLRHLDVCSHPSTILQRELSTSHRIHIAPQIASEQDAPTSGCHTWSIV